MKPTRNRIFCRDCERAKMLFETEKKANNFIHFNQQEIEEESGVAPQRSYYCSFCCGWHITKIKDDIGPSRKEHQLKEYFEQKEVKRNSADKDSRMLNVLESQILLMQPQERQAFIKEQMDSLQQEIEQLVALEVQANKELLREKRVALHHFCIVRKKLGIERKAMKPQGQNKLDEEWRLWFESKGYK